MVRLLVADFRTGETIRKEFPLRSTRLIEMTSSVDRLTSSENGHERRRRMTHP